MATVADHRLLPLKKARLLLAMVLDDTNQIAVAFDKWPTPAAADYTLLASALWQLRYFDSDADIRAKEPEYAEMQVANIRSALDRIDIRIERVEQQIASGKMKSSLGELWSKWCYRSLVRKK